MLPSTSAVRVIYPSYARPTSGVNSPRTVNSYRPSVSTMVEGDYWLYTLPVRATRSRYGRRVRRHDGRRSQFAQILHRGVSRRRCLEERRRGPAHRTRGPLDPLFLQWSGVATGTNYQHASIMQTIRFTDPVEGAVQIRCRAVGPYTCTGGTQDISADDSASQLPNSGSRAPMSRTSARRSRATRRRCSASATRSPITAIRRGCSKRSPGTRDITSMSRGTSRVRKFRAASGAVILDRRHRHRGLRLRLHPGPEPIPRPTGATAQRQ